MDKGKTGKTGGSLLGSDVSAKLGKEFVADLEFPKTWRT